MEYDHLHTQQTNSCSKSTIEALQKDVFMFKVNNKDTGTTSLLLGKVIQLMHEVWQLKDREVIKKVHRSGR